jgi:CheY-like chemotaxis protein
MRVLLVEDKKDFARSIESELARIANCELIWARSRDGALAALAIESFDLILLDRRIPSGDDVLDDSAEHGWYIFQAARQILSGTPIWFLTGTEDVDFATDVLNQHSRSEDLTGTRINQQMYSVYWKRRINECLADVRLLAQRLAELEAIALNMDYGSPALQPAESRVVRIFGRRFNGASIDVKKLDGGLSASRVLKVTVRRADGGLINTAVAKVAPLPLIDDEGNRYRDSICRLTAGGFPQLSERVSVGGGKHGGLFYGVVGDTVESVFDRIASQAAGVDQIPAEVRGIEVPWYAAKVSERVPVSRIRRIIIGDTSLPDIQAELQGIEIGPTEARMVTAANCCQHGDLHCANVVFDQRGHSMLIDFGDTGQSFAAVDPVTFELSTIFHLQRERLARGWPTLEDMAHWVTIDRYVEGCSFPGFVRACRAWSMAEAGSSKEVLAVAYAYGLRQLKYPDTDKNLARALIRACIQHLGAP